MIPFVLGAVVGGIAVTALGESKIGKKISKEGTRLIDTLDDRITALAKKVDEDHEICKTLKCGYENVSTRLNTFIKTTGEKLSSSIEEGKEYFSSVTEDKNCGNNNNDVDLSNATTLGKCPFCSGNILATDDKIVCENSKITGCKFSFPRNMMQAVGKNNLTDAEIESILSEGKVEVTLISKKSGKPYSAYLIPDEQYGIKIELKEKTNPVKETENNKQATKGAVEKKIVKKSTIPKKPQPKKK